MKNTQENVVVDKSILLLDIDLNQVGFYYSFFTLVGCYYAMQ